MINQTGFSERELATRLRNKIGTVRSLSWTYFSDQSDLPIFVSGNFAETPTKYCIKVLEQNYLDLYTHVSKDSKNHNFTSFSIREKDYTTTLSDRTSCMLTSGGTMTFYAHKNSSEELLKRTLDYMFVQNNKWSTSSKMKVNHYLDAAHDFSTLSERIRENPYLNHPGNHFSLAYKISISFEVEERFSIYDLM